MKTIIKIVLISLLAFSGSAQSTVRPLSDTVEVTAPDDRSPVQLRQPPSARLNDYRNDRDYQYHRELKPAASPWAAFLDWFWRKLEPFFASKSYRYLWQYVFLAAMAGLVIWLLYKANVLGLALGSRATHAALPYDTRSENIHEIHFGDQLDAALQQRNYRLAVRLLYLQTLKHLTDRGLIDWQPNKTNRSYVYELSNPSIRRDFETLTRQFEYVWYGEFPLSAERFEPLREAFQKFNRP